MAIQREVQAGRELTGGTMIRREAELRERVHPALQRLRPGEQVHAGPGVMHSVTSAPRDVEPCPEVEPVDRLAGNSVLEVGVEIPEGAVAYEEVVERRIELEVSHQRDAQLGTDAELLEVELVGKPRPDVKAVGLGLRGAG